MNLKMPHPWNGYPTRAGDAGMSAVPSLRCRAHGLKTRATDEGTRIRLAKVLARTALGVIWVYEGLIPKLLLTTQHEIDLVARSGAYWPTPRVTLATLGVCEILGGMWLLSGKSEKTAAALSFALVAAVGPVCAVLEPSIFYHPFGVLSKNLALLACAAVVWLLSSTALAKPQPLFSDNETGGERMASGCSDNPSLRGAEPSAPVGAVTRRPRSK